MSSLSVESTKWAALIIICLVAFATHYTLSGVERFYVQHQQLISDPHFIETDKYWDLKNKASVISFDGSTLKMHHEELSSGVISQQVTVETPAFLRFSMEAGGTNVLPARQSFAGGSATLRLYYGEDRKFRQVTIFRLRESAPMKMYSQDVYVGKDVVDVAVLLRFLHSSGEFRVKNPELSLLAEYPGYTKIKSIFMVCWLLLAVFVVFLLVRVLSRRVLLVSVVLCGVALLGVLSPGGFISQLNLYIAGFIPDGLLSAVHVFFTKYFGVGSLLSSPSASISKVGHITIFFLFGCILGWGYRQVGLVFGAALLAGLALVTEALQVFTHGRSSSLGDVFLDLTGGYFGYLVAALLITAFVHFSPKFRT